MMCVEIIDEEPGPHPGWYDWYFRRGGKAYRLRKTTENSYISHADIDEATGEVNRRPGGSILSFEGEITPIIAYAILGYIEIAEEKAFLGGRNQAKIEIRKAIGL